MEETMKSFSKQPYAVERRKGAIKRLEAQLKAGTKPEFITKTVKKKETRVQTSKSVPLEETDIKRINAELTTLKSRV